MGEGLKMQGVVRIAVGRGLDLHTSALGSWRFVEACRGPGVGIGGVKRYCEEKQGFHIRACITREIGRLVVVTRSKRVGCLKGKVAGQNH